MWIILRSLRFLVFAIGLLCFLSGFFLTRRELGIQSKDLHHKKSERPAQVFLFIIDALRFDFVVSRDDRKCEPGSPYNCFTTIHNLILSQPENALLFSFEADAPTVTAQRLKALTTGTMPTFIDAGSNLNSSIVTDDNWIDQLWDVVQRSLSPTSKPKMIFLGDDTWVSLFPSQFDLAYPFDSFSTMDIETVDNGILERMWDYLPTNCTASWRLMITHFLGVDHIGHTYHAHHPLMTDKLRQMNAVLHEVIERLPPDSTLMLFGDHGMTPEGEHGGASFDETTSALFVYRKPSVPADAHSLERKTGSSSALWDDARGTWISRLPSEALKQPRKVQQIDLVPTLSYLLGVSIPYSSLGKVIPEVILMEKDANLLHVIRENALQVRRYLFQYYSQSKESVINSTDTALSALLEPLDSLFQDAEAIFMSDSPTTPQEEYALSAYLRYLSAVQSHARVQWTEFKHESIIVGLVIMFVGVAMTVSSSLRNSWKSLSLSVYDWCLVMSVLFYMVSVASNSFVQEEHRLAFAIYQALCLDIVANWFKRILTLPNYAVSFDLAFYTGTGISSLLLQRILFVQSSTLSSRVTNGVAFFSSDLLTYIATVSMGCVAIYHVASSNHPRVPLWIRFAISQVSMVCYHATKQCNNNLACSSLPISQPLLETIHLCTPRVVLAICAVDMLSSLVLASLDSKRTDMQTLVVSFINLMTVYSQSPATATIILVFTSCTILWLHLQQQLHLAYHASSSRRDHASIILMIKRQAFLYFFGRSFFFVTGHRCQFNSLQLSVAFVGASSFSVLYGGCALALNTLGHEVLVLLFDLCFAAPQLSPTAQLVSEDDAPPSASRGCASTSKSDSTKNSWLTYEAFEGDLASCLDIYRMCSLCLLCVAVYALRRHLMLWAVFAPKLVFEVAFFAVFVFSRVICGAAQWWKVKCK